MKAISDSGRIFTKGCKFVFALLWMDFMELSLEAMLNASSNLRVHLLAMIFGEE